MLFLNELIKLGLNKGEAEIYASLLQFGEASASQIAKKTDIGRTNIYEYANSLGKRGLVTQFEKSNKIFFRAEDPLQLRDMLEAREREMKELTNAFTTLLPKLEQMYSENINKPVIKFYQGEKGYKEITEKVYTENNDSEIYFLTADLDLYSPPEPKFRNSLLRKQIFTNLVCNTASNIAEFQNRDQRELRKTIQISKQDFLITTDMLIFENNVVIGSFNKEEFAATLINNPEFAKLLKGLLHFSLKNY